MYRINKNSEKLTEMDIKIREMAEELMFDTEDKEQYCMLKFIASEYSEERHNDFVTDVRCLAIDLEIMIEDGE